MDFFFFFVLKSLLILTEVLLLSSVHVDISESIHSAQDFPKMRIEYWADHLSNPVL